MNRTGENHELHGENNFNCTGKITRTARGFKLNGRRRRALFLLMPKGRTARRVLSSELWANCLKHLKQLCCVTSNFSSDRNSKSTKRISVRFKMPKSMDYHLSSYQKLSLLPSLSNEGKNILTKRAQPWNQVRSN